METAERFDCTAAFYCVNDVLKFILCSKIYVTRHITSMLANVTLK